MSQSSAKSNKNARRLFLKKAGALAGGAMLLNNIPAAAKGLFLSNDTIKIALIGCGSRGTGAAANALRTKGPVELVAMADVFRDKIDESYSLLQKNGGYQRKTESTGSQ